MANETKVTLLVDDRDIHSDGCECGSCNQNNVSYGCGIFYDGGDEVIERVYALSEVAALEAAQRRCEALGFEVVQAE